MSTPNDPMPYMSPPPTRALAHTATRRTERANEDDKAAEHARTTGCAWLAEKIATDVTVASGRRPREMGDQTRWSGQEIPETFARLAWHPTQTRLSPLGHIERGGDGPLPACLGLDIAPYGRQPEKTCAPRVERACLRACVLAVGLAGWRGKFFGGRGCSARERPPLAEHGKSPAIPAGPRLFRPRLFCHPTRSPSAGTGDRQPSCVGSATAWPSWGVSTARMPTNQRPAWFRMTAPLQ